MRDLYSENYKTNEESTNEGYTCWWTGIINIVKVSLLPKAIHTCNAITIKIPVAFFSELELILNLYGTTKDTK